MILEGIVTTLDHAGRLNVAPMGPVVEPGMRGFTLRPFQTSQTYRNLKARGEGVLHVTDDSLLFARAVTGTLDEPPTRPAEHINGLVLTESCRYYEFRVTELDDSRERTEIKAQTLSSGTLREFFGFNRARHAVIEAAILATRTEFLPIRRIALGFRLLAEPVRKTGGPDEKAAFRLLSDYVGIRARERGYPWKDPEP